MRTYRAAGQGSVEPLGVEGSTIVPASTKSIASDWKHGASSNSVWQSMFHYNCINYTMSRFHTNFMDADGSLCSKVMFVGSVAVFLVGLAVVLSASLATVASGKDTVVFFVVGDWGRQGTVNQTGVAKLMADVGRSKVPQFVISTGDNFYPNGLNSTDDKLFDLSFKSIYSGKALQVPWYAVLGNHDYGDGYLGYCENDESKTACDRSPKHQLGQALAARDPRWYCQRRYTKRFGNGLVDIFFIDTSPMVLEYHSMEWGKYPGGITEQSWEAQLRELETDIQSSKALWKLVVGHHPPRTNGDHGNNPDLMQHLEPILKAGKVNAYFSGHDHNLEHLKCSDLDTEYFISGAGSDCDRGFKGNTDSMFQYQYSGFTAVEVRSNDMKVDFYSLEGGPSKPIYTTVLK